jgi:uncharacterized protein with ParB-like and HNH nuclease domain
MMKIETIYVTIRDLVKDYVNNREEGGVFGYGGLLDIRPPFQREFIYDDKQRNAVIDTVRKSYPLGLMYWGKNDDGTFEVIDGQQRTISICEYVKGDFAFKGKYFDNLEKHEQDAILDYKLNVYIYKDGTHKEKVDIFIKANTRMSRRKVLSHE